MSNYSQFFLNSSSKVVQLELLEITHPSFTQVWRIVRNAIAGVTVTLEDASSKAFVYYPLKITPSGASSDLDQALEIMFGDLGSILPAELDRVTVPVLQTINAGACIGAWTDNAGALVATPFLVGNGGAFFVPYNATKLQVGMNDSFYSDNQGSWSISLNGGAPSAITPTNKPWTYTAGVLNDAYPYTATAATGPVQRAVTGGTILVIAITGTQGLSPGSTLVDGLGDPTQGNGVGFPGLLISTEPKPGTYTKPIVLYRTYRSDDLTQPLAGPYAFEVNNISFKKEGALLACSAHKLNQSATGEIYTLDRFQMLRGFI